MADRAPMNPVVNGADGNQTSRKGARTNGEVPAQVSANARTSAAAGVGSAVDTHMQGTKVYEVSSAVSGDKDNEDDDADDDDDDEDMMSTDSRSTDWDSDHIRNELAIIESEDDDGMETMSSMSIQGPEDIGRVISMSFSKTGDDYEDDEAKDIFDDGLEDDDSDFESDVSTIYEELSEPSIFVRVLEVPTSQVREESDGEEESLASDDPEAGYTTGEESPEEDDDEVNDEEDEDNEESVAPITEVADESVEINVVAGKKRSFSELEAESYELLFKVSEYSRVKTAGTLEKTHRAQVSREQECDTLRWRLLELEEAKKAIEAEMSLTQQKLEEEENAETEAEEKLLANLATSGISSELYQAYKAFCDSLDPEFGQRGGFSVTCNTDHEGCYTTYDPQFAIFKECIEGSYNSSNFRCEASSLPIEGKLSKDYIVEFWPIQCPDPSTGTKITWGEQYPELYRLASAAVREGSEAAIDMLVRLPDMNSAFDGGWLFDYASEPALKDSPIVGKRWRFRSAHKIDKPCTAKEKRQRLELGLRPENIR